MNEPRLTVLQRSRENHANLAAMLQATLDVDDGATREELEAALQARGVRALRLDRMIRDEEILLATAKRRDRKFHRDNLAKLQRIAAVTTRR